MKKLIGRLMEESRRNIPSGRVADYIPELAKKNRDSFSVSIVTMDGAIAHCGDTGEMFTMQSVSKLFSLALALESIGPKSVFSRVGMNPTSEPFNSILKLEISDSHKPMNPMINAGAIAVVSILPFDTSGEKFRMVLDLVRRMAANPAIDFDENVYLSEKLTGDRNRALAYFMKSTGDICGDVESHLDAYFRQCSIAVTTDDLAVMGATIAGNGTCPVNGERVVSASVCKTLRAMMITCGMYDGSGEFALRVGIPAKSGVSGGILASAPERMGIGVWGPSLDEKGNSVAGADFLERLAEELELRSI